MVRTCDSHDHAPDSTQVKRGLILKKIQTAITTDPSVPVRRVFDKVTAEDLNDSDEMPLFLNVRSRCKRFRSTVLPSIPRSINDDVIPGEWSRTRKGRRFLLVLNNNVGIAVFASRKMLVALQKAKRLFIDGTFRTASKSYQQFITVHGEIDGFVIPLAFVLSTGKLTFQYRKILQELKRQVRNYTNSDLNPQQILTAFESGLMTAIHFEFPRSKLRGCFFHFNQSLWRGIQRFRLTTGYKQDRKLRKMIRRVMSIGFLPTLLVRQNFTLLRTSTRTQSLVRRYPPAGDWLDFVERIYMLRNSPFPPSVYDRSCSTRTNNHAEGYHNRWNGVVGVRHPNIWIFLRKLIDEETHCRHTLRAVERGEAPPKRQERYRILQKKIHHLKGEYRSGRKICPGIGRPYRT